jgi:hypothetical protein
MDSDPIQASVAAAVGDPHPPLPLDDWEFEEELRAARRFADGMAARPDASESRQPFELTYEADGSADTDTSSGRLRSQWTTVLGWGALTVGLTGFFFGGALVLWAASGNRSELWSFSVPLVLIGQAAVFIGVVVLLDGLRQRNRAAERELDAMEQRLQALRSSTLRLSTTHSSAARDFYRHIARGASPQVLLTDLKAQMDLLAEQMAQDCRAA